MSARHPGADAEYSRAPGGLRALGGVGGGLAIGVTVLALIASLVLLVADFTTLFKVVTASSPGPVRTVGTGSHHGYAMVVIGLAAGGLALVFALRGARFALVAVALLGVVALLIALLRDLPSAHATSQLIPRAGGYALAEASPALGMYLETLGAILLLVAGGGGLLALSPEPRAEPGAARR